MKDPIVHFEIPADDVDRAMNFYKNTFGWEFKKWDMPAGSSTGGDPYYGVFTTDVDEKQQPKKPGAINGGLMKRKMPNQPFMNYITAESISDKLESIEANGGEIVMPKTEIAAGMGWIAAFKDPEGNMMGLHEMPDDKE
ncbi:MAG: glyoxalase [Candidatus Magasanikbacteria bacterium CG10_big_fil_rev_8_21_14_0_10_47_10]|uniref:Glyoxalase n=1 Tax=Candidatus Magasanikbacteria bacterium CG10_big_fil_rev_8_21_14_0_10_47_10 TaxID=1974652 RepID=A0A2H0TPD7_9BACT|nr:MAG: glyoxalase [Candidatus Magasanikbacteria bacterium CG10_big_fil_rev_8_21_14_0_10_47_10]